MNLSDFHHVLMIGARLGTMERCGGLRLLCGQVGISSVEKQMYKEMLVTNKI